MIILGFHCGHNASAAIMVDGRLVGAVQEERFSKRKNQVAFPARAIAHLVKVHLGGDAGRIGKVAMATTEVDPVGLAVARYSDFGVADHVRENHEYWKPVFYGGAPNEGSYWREMFRRGEKLNADQNIDVSYMHSDRPLAELVRYVSDVARPAAMREQFGYNGPCEAMDHHSCHAYYAFHGATLSPARQQDALVLTADSWGDGINWSAWVAEPQGVLRRVAFGADHGIARIYRNITLIMGMKPNEHEYKVMGLSGYSRPSKYVDAVEQILSDILDFREGRFVRTKPLKESYFDLRDRLEGHRFDNIAAGVQSWSTRVTAAWIRYWLKETGRRGLCYSGGLSMNIKANGEILEMSELDWMSVPASGGDETLPLGACFMAARQSGKPVESLRHVYLGEIDGRAGVEDDWRHGVAAACQAPEEFEVLRNVTASELAKLLAANVILARCVGPMEFGARSLGNRSILANPADVRNVKRINDAIKNRDFWMPFTPSILEEKAARYLVNPKGVVSPYMTIGFRTTEAAARDIPAALHPGDFTARPQFVSRQTNPTYWELISEFEKLTCIPALLNTSLNLHGEPMNSTVADAARTVALSALDCLAMPGDRLLVKRPVVAAIKAIIDVKVKEG
jgi:carbamoyltransferase